MTPADWKGFSERLTNWGHNESINSVLITCPNAEDVIGADGSMVSLSAHYRMTESIATSPEFVWNRTLGYEPPSPQEDQVQRHRMLGLDPLAIPSSSYDDGLDGILQLASAMMDPSRKTPIIACPNGFVSDGGLAFFLGQYVLATPETSFRIDHPTRGLAFDPCGISFVLPRVGLDSSQPTATKYASTIAKLLALTGLEADACDLIGCGLATHYVDALHNLPLMEAALSEIPAYQHQGLFSKSTRSQGEWWEEKDLYLKTGRQKEDGRNQRFRNVAVHELLQDVSVGMAGQDDFLAGPMAPPQTTKGRERNAFDDEEEMVMGGGMGSTLLNIATTFHPIFEEEKTVYGMMERLEEIAGSTPSEEMESEVIEVATYLWKGMTKRSPLSLMAMHKLLTLGEHPATSMEECMAREKMVQKNLLHHDDFQNWATAMKKGVSSENYKDWKHSSLKDVTYDEVEELFHEI